MKQVHYYDNNNLYTTSEPAFLDIEETEKQGRNVYFCPTNATLVDLPKLKQFEIPKFNGINWDIISDYRGRFQVNSDMELSEVTKVGDIEDGYILVTNEQAVIIGNDPDFFIIDNGELVENPNYEEDKQARRRRYLDSLTLTPSDVERALFKAKEWDFDDLKAFILQNIPTINIKGLSIEFRAKDFYRGAEFNGQRLFDIIGALLGYTPADMDYLFEHKELPERNNNV